MGKVERLTNNTTGGPVYVDVEDGRILRITPIEFDDTDAPSWTIEARGRKFTPPRKTTTTAWTLAHKSTIYSPRRILTPLKRVDFDPKGNRNCKNMGISGYQPISWNEALDLVGEEILRVRREVGPAGMLTAVGSHHLWGNVGYRFSAYLRFMNLVGFTYAEHHPDSWEGWFWGAMHMWGHSHGLGMPSQNDLLEDALKNTEMVVLWSSDPESTCACYEAHESTPWRYWLKELGVEMVFVDPYYNNTATLFGDKWLAPRPGTDVALALAIAYTWISEGTYDKEYVDRNTLGFDQWKAYVLGESDGQPKSPKWAEVESGVPARDIRALARAWARKKTMLGPGGLGTFGGACRQATGAEWARAMIALVTLQGMGNPGSNMWSTAMGCPTDQNFKFPGYTDGGISGDIATTGCGLWFVYRMFPDGHVTGNPHHSSEGQTTVRLRVPEAMMHIPHEWRGRGLCGSHIEAQFVKYQYPAPGYPMVTMYYKYGSSYIGVQNETNRFIRAYRNDKVPFVVNQSIWFEGEAQFADIILPACTNFERWDLSEFSGAGGYAGAGERQNCNHRVLVLQKKCIEPVGESKSDYDIFAELSKRLDIYDAFTDGGKTEYDWVKQMFYASDLAKAVSWEEFEKKGYYVVPVPDPYVSAPAWRWFAEDRERDTPTIGPMPWEQVHGKGLQTQSGKIEFVSNSLRRFEATGVVDPERPVMGPQYIPSWEGHRTPELTVKYPLQMISPHPRFSFHTHGDAKGSWSNDIKDHRVLKEDGHHYWIMRVNPTDAQARGIQEGDLIRAYNDRGSVILAARVTSRVPPGVVHSYESSAEYDPLGTPGESSDRGGCVNLLTPSRFMTPTSTATAANSCLIEVEKWEGECK